jgi:hypothetical protein
LNACIEADDLAQPYQFWAFPSEFIRFARWRELKRLTVVWLFASIPEVSVCYKNASEFIQSYRSPLRIFFFQEEIEIVVDSEAAQPWILDNNLEVTGRARMRSQAHRFG